MRESARTTSDRSHQNRASIAPLKKPTARTNSANTLPVNPSPDRPSRPTFSRSSPSLAATV
ncbi:MAG: hypothetical protein V7K24_23900 [Nostoc sp.]